MRKVCHILGTVASFSLFRVSKVTVNRMLALIRAILNKAAHEWEWLEKMPKIPSRGSAAY